MQNILMVTDILTVDHLKVTTIFVRVQFLIFNTLKNMKLREVLFNNNSKHYFLQFVSVQ